MGTWIQQPESGAHEKSGDGARTKTLTFRAERGQGETEAAEQGYVLNSTVMVHDGLAYVLYKIRTAPADPAYDRVDLIFSPRGGKGADKIVRRRAGDEEFVLEMGRESQIPASEHPDWSSSWEADDIPIMATDSVRVFASQVVWRKWFSPKPVEAPLNPVDSALKILPNTMAEALAMVASYNGGAAYLEDGLRIGRTIQDRKLLCVDIQIRRDQDLVLREARLEYGSFNPNAYPAA
jgi:hypothetical protein